MKEQTLHPPLVTRPAGIHGRVWDLVPLCIRAVWRGGLQHVAVASGWCRSQPQIVLCGLGQGEPVASAVSVRWVRRAHTRSVSSLQQTAPSLMGDSDP